MLGHELSTNYEYLGINRSIIVNACEPSTISLGKSGSPSSIIQCSSALQSSNTFRIPDVGVERARAALAPFDKRKRCEFVIHIYMYDKEYAEWLQHASGLHGKAASMTNTKHNWTDRPRLRQIARGIGGTGRKCDK
jgi:hypothetical protein